MWILDTMINNNNICYKDLRSQGKRSLLNLEFAGLMDVFWDIVL